MQQVLLKFELDTSVSLRLAMIALIDFENLISSMQHDSMAVTGGHSVWHCGMLQNCLAMHMCTWGLQCSQYVLIGLQRTYGFAKRKGCTPRKCHVDQTEHHKHTKLGIPGSSTSLQDRVF